jgi:hypothetical protein
MERWMAASERVIDQVENLSATMQLWTQDNGFRRARRMTCIGCLVAYAVLGWCLGLW